MENLEPRSLTDLPPDLLALIYKKLTTRGDRKSLFQCTKAMRVPQVFELIKKTTMWMGGPQPTYEVLVNFPRGAVLTELVVKGRGGSIDLVSLSQGKGGTEVQKMERERALLAGVQLLQLEDQYYDAGSIDTMMPAWRAFFHLCQASLDTIVSHELPAQFLSALADANLPCLRTVRIDKIVFLADSPDELQALQVVQQKFSGVEWEVHAIQAPVATLMEMKGMAVAQCVERIDTYKPRDRDDLWFDELSHAFPRAAITINKFIKDNEFWDQPPL